MMESDQDEAINLLSLDGGGVRGVTSLLILHHIMVKIKEKQGLVEIPKPCDVFHMIAGTSTGGLIAIMLGRLRMSTEEALRQYDICAATIFSSRKWANMTEKFHSTPLRETIQKLVRDKDMGELMRDPTNPSKGKALVCVMPRRNAGPSNVRRVRSFSPARDNWDKDIKIWEAARATTAATTFFKPQPLKSGSKTEDYIDAALGVNNPVNHLIDEAINEFGTGRRLGCLLSIGTGTRGLEITRAESGLKNVYQLWGGWVNIGKALKNVATDAEGPHSVLAERLRDDENAYFRFNVPDAADKVKLHHYEKMSELKSMTNEYLSDPDVTSHIERVAGVLESENCKHGLTLAGLLKPSQERGGNSMKAKLMGEASRYFTGRNDIIQKLIAFFSDREGEITPRREFCLHGLGGVGKTQIALKAANIFRHGSSELGVARKRRFKHILYVDGTDDTTISQSYATIARDEFGIEAGNSDQLKRAVLRKLRDLDEDWFLIYDNCNQEDRRGLLPAGDSGNILYTTRNRIIRDLMLPECFYNVDVLEQLDAIRLLLTASGPEYAQLSAWHQSIGGEIVQELGCLPLAIDQAAAYIRAGECRLDGYMEVFRKQRVALLKNPVFKGSSPQNQAVYTTFEASYQAIVAIKHREGNTTLGINAELALRALNMMSFWHNEDIPALVAWYGAISWRNRRDMGEDAPAKEEHLVKLTGDPSMTWQKFFFRLTDTGDGEFPAALEILERYSLITFRERKYASMHVLVHSWARDRMKGDVRRQQALIARVLLLDSIGDNLSLTFIRQYHQRIYSHVMACMKHYGWKSKLLHEPYELMLREKYAFILTFQKQFGEAEAEYLRILHATKLCFGSTARRVQTLLKSLAMLYHEMGRLGEAEMTLLECIDRWEIEQYLERSEIEARAKSHLLEIDTRALNKSQRNKKNKRDDDSPPTTPTSDVNFDYKVRNFMPGWGSLEARQLQRAVVEEKLAHIYYDQAKNETDLELCQEFMTSALARRKKILHPNCMVLWQTEDEDKRKTHLRDLDYWLNRFEAVKETFLSNDLDEASFLTDDYRGRLVQAMSNSMVATRRSIRPEFNKDGQWDWLWPTAFKNYTSILETAFTQNFGESDYRSLEVMRWMIECLIGMERYDEAEALARKCLHLSILGYGECHQETILSLEKLHQAIVSRLGGYDLEAVYIAKEAWYRADAVFGLYHRITKRMWKKVTTAMENYDSELSSWVPDYQMVLIDPHWEYAVVEDYKTRVALLGQNAHYHDMSYTIPDPAFEATLRAMESKRKNKSVLEQQIMVDEPATASGSGQNGSSSYDDPAASHMPKQDSSHRRAKYETLKTHFMADLSRPHKENGDPRPSTTTDRKEKGIAT